MPGHVEDGEAVAVPGEALAFFEGAVDADRGGEQAGDVVAGRVLQDVGEVLEDPGLDAVLLLEPGQAGQVVVVVVAGDDGLDLCEAGGGLEVVQGVLDEAEVGGEVVPAGEAVVQEDAAAVVGQEAVDVGAGVGVGPEVGEELLLRLVDGVGPDRPDAARPQLALGLVEVAEVGGELVEGGRRRRSSIGWPCEPRTRSGCLTRTSRVGVERRADAVGEAVLPLEVVDGVDGPGLGDQVAGDGDGLAVDLEQVGDGALGVAGGREDLDGVAAPLEALVVLEALRDRDGARQGVADAGDVVVVVDALQAPEGVGLGEEGGLALGHGDRDAALGRAGSRPGPGRGGGGCGGPTRSR